jgi:hypothetical protein
MIITKRRLIEDAYGEIGLASYFFDLEPGMLERSLRVMDSILAEWNSEGVRIGYPLSSNSDLDEECDIPDVAINAIVQNVALRVASSHGKPIQPSQQVWAKRAYNSLLSWAMSSSTPEVDISALPSGAGNKPGRAYREFMPKKQEDLSISNDNTLDFE